jgi:beta-fructofuranosidase
MSPPSDDRPRFHLTPPGGWMNDPNGLHFADGRLHVTYQHNPDAPRWGRMHWGHAVTDDLVTWRHSPVALSPGDVGPDVDGCWSGSIVGDGDAAVLFYTGVRLDQDLRRQSICRAFGSDRDLVRWTKDPDNPLIPQPPPGIEPDLFRDPFVWRDRDRWAMLVGAGTTDGRGTVLLYRSPDLRAWTLVGPILATDDVDPAIGSDGPVWECPQLLHGRDVDVLIVSVVDRAPGIRPSHVMAFVGRLDQDRFLVAHAQQLGMGPDFYAPATTVMPDGRWLLFGWIPEDPPAPGSDRTWAGSLTFPRVVAVGEHGTLSLSLAAELEACRGPGVVLEPRDIDDTTAPWRVPVPDGPFEVSVHVEPRDVAEFIIELLDDEPGEPVCRVAYRPADRRLSIARRGIVSVAGRSAMSTAVIPDADGAILGLRAILDGSVLELETNGHMMATLRLPGHARAPRTLQLAAVGGRARVDSLETWPLEPHRRPGSTDRGAGIHT